MSEETSLDQIVKYIPHASDKIINRIKKEFTNRQKDFTVLSETLGLIARTTKDKNVVNQTIDTLIEFKDNEEIFTNLVHTIKYVAEKSLFDPNIKEILTLIQKYKNKDPELFKFITHQNTIKSKYMNSGSRVRFMLDILNSDTTEQLIEKYDLHDVKQMIDYALRIVEKTEHKTLATDNLTTYNTDKFKEIINNYQCKEQIIYKIHILTSSDKPKEEIQTIIEVLHDHRRDNEKKLDIEFILYTDIMNLSSGYYLEAEAELPNELKPLCEFDKKYPEVRTFLQKNDMNRKLLQKITKTLKQEREYIKTQNEGFALPLLAILSENETYTSKIKELNNNDKLNLSRAWNIAYKNIDESTSENYLTTFYAGLKQTLDEDYENLDKWCDTIIKGFSKIAETGRSLSEVMGR
ncbi:hypothetical protein HOK51_03180 [Candidatus Woesearchaeota archaeon]|jgi:hypothetical protein|nr:hypothetical protein [Candidatus Woesearchaeota archaeon]MBT6518822.1 hypothetical protein [Candidatus Woesearchaeota archaeon]MBT7367961.1 hypothetical protein [Candidatus Woesearchaeota archaeon]